MSVPDGAMSDYMRLLTSWKPEKIDDIEKRVSEERLHPRDAKMMLALEITGIFHGEKAAGEAADSFKRIFQQRMDPDDMPIYHVARSTLLVDFLAKNGLVSSKGEARRLIRQGGIRLSGEKVGSTAAVLDIEDGTVLQVGKRRFVGLSPSE